MREKTDLEGVKFVAKQLVMIDIHLTEYSPIVVQHPFTSSGIAAAPSKDGLRLLDITKSEEDLRAWQGYNGTGKEHYGFASRKDVADFESGREDEIYEYVSIETYKKMDYCLYYSKGKCKLQWCCCYQDKVRTGSPFTPNMKKIIKCRKEQHDQLKNQN